MTALAWMQRRDRDLAALRRAGRAAIVMPAIFALGDKVIDNPAVATFAAFGAFAMLLLVDFRGPVRVRLEDQVALAVVGGVFVCVGTLASRAAWLAALAMAVIGFAVIFASVVSSALSAATTALLLAFILPVSLRGPASSIPDRLAGWAIAAGASCVAIVVLWPAPARDPLRQPVVAVCRALAARLRAEVASVLSGAASPTAGRDEGVIADADAAVAELRRTFYATPYRPTGLSTGDRAIIRLVDEMSWLDAIIASASRYRAVDPLRHGVCKVKSAAAQVLDLGAQLLERPSTSPDDLRAALGDLGRSLRDLESAATATLPVGLASSGGSSVADERRVSEFFNSLDPSFRSQELSFAVSQIAANIDLAAAAGRRTWLERLTGRQPPGLTSTLTAAQERAASHVERHSVTLHNSLRGAIGLGLAVLVADLTGVQHSFWVVLGTLSVLRSNALSTGQNVVTGLFGTVIGFVIGAGVLALIGTNVTVLWLLLPLSILLAGVAPAVISFAAGQAAFTIVLVVLFNIIQPLGWRVGLLRVEDIALGCGVSLVVGVLFWPRGAASALGGALADAYDESVRYLARAVEFAMGLCDACGPLVAEPLQEATRASAAARRLDDAFRGYLAERGAKPAPLAEVTGLVTGVVGLRLAAAAVLDIWQRSGPRNGERSAARQEVLAVTRRVTSWYEALAASLVDGSEVPSPLERDESANQRLVRALRRDLRGDDGNASATAVRVIWTADHVDAVVRLQRLLAEPARAVAESHRVSPLSARAIRSAFGFGRGMSRGAASR